VDAFELHAFSLSRGGSEKNLRRQVYRYPPGFVGRCNCMAAWRETGAGVAIFAHRVKTILLTLLIVVFALVCTLIVIAEPTAWFGWFGVLLFGVGGAYAVFRWARGGAYTGKPLLLLDHEGLEDRQTGVRVRWDDVESVELLELHVRGTTQRYLGLHVRDPEAIVGGVGTALLGLMPPGWPPVSISTSMLGTTTEELAGLVRRFYRGPVEGLDEEPDATAERPSRLRRLGRWAFDWAVGIAIAIPILALIVWLS
jgi:hypothetical protein